MSGNQTGDDYDLAPIMDNVMGADVVVSGLPHGDVLNAFVEAVCARDPGRTASARGNIVDAMGTAAMVDAAAVIAAFNAYPRMADATGIPLEDAKAAATTDMRLELGLEAHNNL